MYIGVMSLIFQGHVASLFMRSFNSP